VKREQVIIRAAWWSIAGNAVLALMKLVVGFISGSFAVIADGIDSASDIASSLVVLFAARIISRPPNVRFPYGYQKADTVASKVLSFVIFFAGTQLAWTSLRVLSGGGSLEVPSSLAVWVTLVSIAGKITLALYLMRKGRQVESPMLLANAKNMRNDVLVSLTVLASLVFSVFLKIPIMDRIFALLISGFIMYSAFRLFMKANIDLMDGLDDPDLYRQLFEAVGSVQGASRPHRVRARKIGYYYMVNLDIEVNSFLSVKEAHEIARRVEKSIKTNLPNIYDVMVHVEPLGNEEKDEKYGISESEINNE